MKRMCLILCSLCFINSFAQEKYEYQPTLDIRRAAYEFSSEKKYSEAIEILENVSVSDTGYAEVLADMAYFEIEAENYDRAYALADSAISLKLPNHLRFSLIKAISLEKQEKYDEVLLLYDSLKLIYPFRHELYHNIGLIHEKTESWTEAIDSYKQGLFYNYFDDDLHSRLAYVYIKNAYPTQAILAYTMAAVVTLDSDKRLGYIALIEKIALGEIEAAESKITLEGSERFKDLDVLIKNKIGINKDYKFKSDLDNFTSIKTIHFLLEQVQPGNEDEFWTENYISLLKPVIDKGLFDGMGVLIMEPFKEHNSNFMKVYNRNQKDLQDFIAYINPLLNDLARIKPVTGNDAYSEVYFNILDGIFVSTGPYKDGKSFGEWKYYHENGRLKAIGNYDEEGIEQGTWNFYFDNGNLSSTTEFKDGKGEGEKRTYFYNGKPTSVTTLKDSEINGVYQSYLPTGAPDEKVNYTNGILNGPAVYYHPIGTVRMELTYKDGKADGKLTRFYSAGEVESTENLSEGKYHGDYIRYHQNGKIATSGNYVGDKREGSWEIFYENGKLKEHSEYKDGILVGKLQRYDVKGNLTEEYELDTNGKRNGSIKYYNSSGQIYGEQIYKKGELIAYKYFDKDGNLISEGQKKGKNLELEFKNVWGTTESKGTYYNDEKHGIWHFYYPNGALLSTETYENGKIVKPDSSFFQNGTLKNVYGYNEEGERHGYFVNYNLQGGMFSQGSYWKGATAGKLLYYYSNGTLKEESYYNNDELNGWNTYYDNQGRPKEKYLYFYDHLTEYVQYDTTGNILSRVNFDKENVNYLKYHFNGSKYCDVSYAYGIIHGPFTYYYYDGKKELEGQYLGGKRTGKWSWYNLDGGVSNSGEYKNGEKIGVWIKNDEFGNPVSKLNYNIEGNISGISEYYYQDGKIKFTAEYLDGNRHGKHIYYAPDGEVQYYRIYEDDLLIGYSYHSADGSEMNMIPIKNETGEIRGFFKNGKPSVKFDISYGLLNNDYTKYKSDGSVTFTSVLEDGEYNGAMTEYYGNGNLMEELQYLHDELNGECSYYYPNGKLRLKVNYLMGEKNGVAEYYTEDGKLQKKLLYFQDNAISEL